MNLPNKLTVLRVILVPFFMFFIIFKLPFENGELVSRLLAAFIFAVATASDFLDGKIARKYNLITDFGKFMDPLADKFMIFGAILAFNTSPMFVYSTALKVALIVASTIVIFRELAITSLRLVVAGSEKHVVIAANMLGKYKTTFQCIWVLVFILEPLVWDCRIFSWISIVIMGVLTVISGINYVNGYWPYLDSNK